MTARHEHRPLRRSLREDDETPSRAAIQSAIGHGAAAGGRRVRLRRARCAWRRHASTVPGRGREPGVAEAPERALCRLRLAPVEEQTVDRRAGARDIGAEGSRGAQLVGERRAREIVRRERGEVEQALDRARASSSAARARPSRALRRARRTPRRRPLSRSSPCRGSSRTTTQKSCGKSSSASSLPSPEPSCGPLARKNGTSAPIPAAMACSSAAGSGSASEPFARRSAVAASELPPPRPAASGMCFSILTRQRGSTPAAAARRSRAARTSVSSVNPSTRSSAPRPSISIRSTRSIRWRTVSTSCLPSSRVGPTTSARLIFAAAGARIIRAPPRARRTRAARAPRRARSPAGRAP